MVLPKKSPKKETLIPSVSFCFTKLLTPHTAPKFLLNTPGTAPSPPPGSQSSLRFRVPQASQRTGC